MNKKISELDLIPSGEEGFIPIVESSSGETKKISIADILAPIGTVISSMLTVEQFNAITFGTWMLMDGQSCAGTSYANITGKSNVPDMVTNGEFPRQATTGRELGTPEGDAIRNITGVFGAEGLSRDTGATSASGALYHASRSHPAYGGTSYNSSVRIGFDASRVVPTATENRPKNIAFNFFIRVN